LRPHRDVCDQMRRLIAGHSGRTLLLGVTPELAIVSQRTIAVDRSGGSLASIWPGNDAARTAVQGNWLDLPFPRAAFAGAIGDGSFNCLDFPHGYRRVLRELARVIRPGGRICVRVYVTPESCESLSEVRAATLAGRVSNVDALKWRLAHALCAARKDANLPVRAIWAAFNCAFPDRDALLGATGWTADDLAHIDAYAVLPDTFSFPTLDQVFSVVSESVFKSHLAATTGYELADRCPILVLDVH
jgi:SAM-dependent methyltransferase